MATREDLPRRIRRLVVLADASPRSRAALEAAADLASRHGAELVGLFVEDEDLLRIARMPFAREVGSTSATTRPMDPRQMERLLRAQAGEIRRFLASLENRFALRCSLRVARGQAVAEVLAVAGPEDLLVVQRRGWAALRGGPGAIARRLVEEPRLTVMVLPGSQPRATQPVLALFEDRETGPRSLEVASFLARSDSRGLTVLLPPQAEGAGEELSRAASRWLDRHGLVAEIQQASGPLAATLAQTARRTRAQAVVVHRQSPILADEVGRRLLEALDTPLVVVS